MWVEDEINLTSGLTSGGSSQLKWSVTLAKVNTVSAEFPLLRRREYAALSQTIVMSQTLSPESKALSQTIVMMPWDKQCEKLETS